MNINQTKQDLKRIEEKQTLGLPLSERETALLTLYGELAESTTDAATPAPVQSDEYDRKAAFVEKHLAPMLAAAEMQVKHAEYRHHIATNEEYVDIVYISGYKCRVCVTADSLGALVADVMRALQGGNRQWL